MKNTVKNTEPAFRAAGQNTLLLYGQVDHVIGSDLVVYPFRQYLSKMLHENGFDCIVFYDATRTAGKHVSPGDDQSAYYAFPQNREAYLRKYGSAPDGAAKESSTAGQEYRVGGARATEAEPEEMVYRQQFLDETIFFSELEKEMLDTDHRTAIVIMNLFDVLRNGERSFTRRLAFLMNNVLSMCRKDTGNLLMFMENDVHDAASADYLVRQLAESSLRDHFLIQRTDHCFDLDPEKCLCISTPGTDEIALLLRKYSMQGEEGRRLILQGGDPEKLAETLRFHLHEGYSLRRSEGGIARPVTLRRLELHIQDFLSAQKENPVMTRQNIGQLSPYPAKHEEDPEQKLRTTRGWETAAESILAEVARFELLHPEFCTGAATQRVPGDNVPERLGGAQPRSYPPAVLLPHIMLSGPPGVGKTTVARLIGQILHTHGMLSIGHTVEVKASQLIAEHVGGTGPLIASHVRSAEGGILFLDESYLLFEKENSGAGFKHEAITALVQALTSETEHFVLILSGYDGKETDGESVQSLLSMNPGLASRIKVQAVIPQYCADLLAEIAAGEMKRYRCEPGTDITQAGLVRLFGKLLQKSNRRHWANARTVIDYMNKVISHCLERGSHTVEAEDFPEEDRVFLSGREKSYEELIRQMSGQYPGLGETAGDIAKRAVARMRSLRARSGEGQALPVRHMIFSGRPGTGKTTLAIHLASLLGACDVLSGAEPVLIEDPQHCTAQTLSEAIENARMSNTVLLIDESDGLREDLAAQLLSPMSECRDLLVIFNVMKDLSDFRKRFPALASRCDIYQIEDYTPEQLGRIFERFAEQDGYGLAPGLTEELGFLFRNWYALRDVREDYGNARQVRLLFERMCSSCDMRTREGDYILTDADIPEAERETIRLSKCNADLDTVLAELNGYVGLENVREFILKLKQGQETDRYFGIRREHGRVSHFAFLGNPGTGKTTAAELLSHALYALGELKSPQFTKLSARDLVAGYVGQTSGQTRRALETGRGGLLLVDEAYVLTARGGDAVSEFRSEAIAELLLFMEEERGRTVVVFAGYGDETEAFLRSNPGLYSRVGNILRFRDYTPEECLEIVRRNLERHEYRLQMNREAKAACLRTIAALCKRRDFANARDMRNLSESIVTAFVTRLNGEIHAGNAPDPESGDAHTVIPEDIPAA